MRCVGLKRKSAARTPLRLQRRGQRRTPCRLGETPCRSSSASSGVTAGRRERGRRKNRKQEERIWPPAKPRTRSMRLDFCSMTRKRNASTWLIRARPGIRADLSGRTSPSTSRSERTSMADVVASSLSHVHGKATSLGKTIRWSISTEWRVLADRFRKEADAFEQEARDDAMTEVCGSHARCLWIARRCKRGRCACLSPCVSMTCRHGGTLGYEELHLLLDGQSSELDSASPWNGESDEQDAQRTRRLNAAWKNPVPWRNARRTEAAQLDFARPADAASRHQIDGSEETPRQDKELRCNKIEAEASYNQHGGRHQDNRCSTDTRNTRRLSFSGPHLRSREEHAQIFSSWNAHEQVSCSRRDQVQQAHSPVTMFSSKTSQHHQSLQRRQKHTGGDLDNACRQAAQRV